MATFLFVGSYAPKGCNGIYVYKFDDVTGKASFVDSTSAVDMPSYLAVSPDCSHLYAVSEKEQGAVAAFSIDKKGHLRFLNQQPAPAAPCYLSANGVHVFTANYGAGSITVFPVFANGQLGQAVQQLEFSGSGPVAERQDNPHIHCVKFCQDGRYLYASDLGTDSLYCYRYDAAAVSPLAPMTVPLIRSESGSGPRHLAFHPGGKFAYLLHELDAHISVLKIKNGIPEPVQKISCTDPQYDGKKSAADIAITSDGCFLYASNREPLNDIRCFHVDSETGMLTDGKSYASGGHEPRGIAIAPDGNFLVAANQKSDEVCVFRRDDHCGLPGKPINRLKIKKPSCLVFAKTG